MSSRPRQFKPVRLDLDDPSLRPRLCKCCGVEVFVLIGGLWVCASCAHEYAEELFEHLDPGF